MSASSSTSPFDLSLAARDCVSLGVRKAARALGQAYDAAFEQFGLKSTQFALLNAVSLLDGPSINRLAEILVTDRTTLTRNLRPLQKEGLVEIRAGRDRRVRTVHASEAGRQRLALCLVHWKRTQDRFVRALGEERAARLLDDLRFLVEVAREE